MQMLPFESRQGSVKTGHSILRLEGVRGLYSGVSLLHFGLQIID
jgi:hypothetical protein